MPLLTVRNARPSRFLADRRGSVAVVVGIMGAVLLTVMAFAVEVTSWSVSTLELQRIADASAWAGATQYKATGDPKIAASAAADMAEINGVASTANRTWNASSLTMSDNLITAQVISGILDKQGHAVKVTVQRSVPKTLSLIVPTSTTSVTLSATAVVEVGSPGPQPCILGLGAGVDGVTTGSDLTVGGNANLVANGCSVRSDDGITENGSASINASGVYAGGTISGSGVCCNLNPNAGQIPDPYANNAAVQTALGKLKAGTGTSVSLKPNGSPQTIAPGSYSGWSINGQLKLGAGLYVVNGDISVGAQGGITGSGVTIVMSGTLSTTGGSTVALSAPSTSTGGTVPGVVLAGTGTTTMSFLGNSSSPITGVLYFPNANLKFAGTSSSGSSGCTEVIASTITLVGTSNLGANCSQYGALAFGSKVVSITLVQ